MCDFFSGIVRVDGKFHHARHNSHSTMVEEAGWRENDHLRNRFSESEWNGEGDYPGAAKICRGEINEKQAKTVDRIYGALAELLKNPAACADRMLFGEGIFAGAEYADVRWRVLIDPKCPKTIAKRLCETTLFVSKALQPKHELPPWLKSVAGDLDLSSYGHALPAGFTHCGGDLYLSSYGHALPAGFTHCGGYLYLRSYGYALPAGFTHCGGDLYLSSYGHALPAGFTHCGGDLDLSSYGHALPAGFTHCGGYLYLRSYGHALPKGFKKNHTPDKT